MNVSLSVVRSAAAGCLAAACLAGCLSTRPEGDPVTFEFPFVNNYDVINRTVFAWDDSYVTLPATNYHHELAGPLSALAASAYGYRLFTDVRSLMDLGFPPERLWRRYGEQLSYADRKYGRDRVGCTVASRQTEYPGEDYKLVFVVIRGTFGRDEWISNINLANTWGADPKLDPATKPNFHEGFSKAAEDVLEFLRDYARAFKIDLSTAKIVVTGHSRGGAVANLVGRALDDAASAPKVTDFASVKGENVYVYTFAAPNVSLGPVPGMHGARYRNIFNIVNPEDLVARVPFAAWSCDRFGRDLNLRSYDYLPWLGSLLSPAYGDMKRHVREIGGYDYYHMLFGTNLTERLPAFATRMIPTLSHYYYVKPEMRAEGNLTSSHSFLEMVLWRNMASADDKAQNVSLAGDVKTLATAYDDLTNGNLLESKARKLDHRLRFRKREKPKDAPFDPDGRDFSRQPGLFDLTWMFVCTHAPLTYVAWMKSGDDHGPEAIYANWEDGF